MCRLDEVQASSPPEGLHPPCNVPRLSSQALREIPPAPQSWASVCTAAVLGQARLQRHAFFHCRPQSPKPQQSQTDFLTSVLKRIGRVCAPHVFSEQLSEAFANSISFLDPSRVWEAGRSFVLFWFCAVRRQLSLCLCPRASNMSAESDDEILVAGVPSAVVPAAPAAAGRGRRRAGDKLQGAFLGLLCLDAANGGQWGA